MICHLSALPPLRDVIREAQLSAKKSFGQNFLLDLNLTRKIARAVHITPEDTLIEIGAGPGGLTRGLLLEGAQNVIAFEKDPRCVEALQPLVTAAEGRLTLIQQDALTVDYRTLGTFPRKVAANLPYNISTPILILLLQQLAAFASLTLMFQREVAERLVAKPRTKAYGRLSVLCQTLCDVKMLFDIPPSAFVPAPKIVSTVVQLVPKKDFATVDMAGLEKLTAAAFGQRRKMLKSSLASIHPDVTACLITAGIAPTARAEELTPQDFLTLLAGL
jgi:16S rRNA (adenine1518-N6/adenine1519-N6)-dimethyltransferase